MSRRNDGIDRRKFLKAGLGTAAGIALTSGAVHPVTAAGTPTLATPDEMFGWQGVLWLAGMVALVVSCARWYGRTMDESSPSAHRWTDDALPVPQSSVLSPQPLRWTWVEGGVFGGAER